MITNVAFLNPFEASSRRHFLTRSTDLLLCLCFQYCELRSTDPFPVLLLSCGVLQVFDDILSFGYVPSLCFHCTLYIDIAILREDNWSQRPILPHMHSDS